MFSLLRHTFGPGCAPARRAYRLVNSLDCEPCGFCRAREGNSFGYGCEAEDIDRDPPHLLPECDVLGQAGTGVFHVQECTSVELLLRCRQRHPTARTSQ